MKPDEKVAIDMTTFCVSVCEAGSRAQYPGINEGVYGENLRVRCRWFGFDA